LLIGGDGAANIVQAFLSSEVGKVIDSLNVSIPSTVTNKTNGNIVL
jgi:hypothetical protein